MKATKETQNKDRFPILMSYEDDSFVVLFSSETEGTVVWANEKEEYRAGHYSDFWDSIGSKSWKPFTGRIILEN